MVSSLYLTCSDFEEWTSGVLPPHETGLDPSAAGSKWDGRKPRKGDHTMKAMLLTP